MNTASPALYGFLADAVLVAHFSFVAFVVVGFLLILAGPLFHWQWIYSRWFRWLHVGAIGVVVLQAWLGRLCPLTIWEAELRRRAWRFGIRLAADMVPNHTGLDSDWMVEHPDWFIGQDRCPFPAYSFAGRDLSSRPEIGVYLEDHYFDNSDAAVVFKHVDNASGRERYIYHGNDGTSMPWNDTAQIGNDPFRLQRDSLGGEVGFVVGIPF